MKKNSDRALVRLVIATGISSVVTRLLTILELLTQFQGNEIVIALVLFNWLCLGGLGTLLSRIVVNSAYQHSRGMAGSVITGYLGDAEDEKPEIA